MVRPVVTSGCRWCGEIAGWLRGALVGRRWVRDRALHRGGATPRRHRRRRTPLGRRPTSAFPVRRLPRLGEFVRVAHPDARRTGRVACGRSPDLDPAQCALAWEVDFVIGEERDGSWVWRHNPAVTMTLAELTWIDEAGVRFARSGCRACSQGEVATAQRRPRLRRHLAAPGQQGEGLASCDGDLRCIPTIRGCREWSDAALRRSARAFRARTSRGHRSPRATAVGCTRGRRPRRGVPGCGCARRRRRPTRPTRR